MPKKRPSPEQIVTLLRQIEVATSQGKPVAIACREAQVVIEQWRKHYNTVRPHSSLGYRPPAPQAISPVPQPLGHGAPR